MSLVDSAYNMDFAKDDLKAKLWVEQLTKYGDYDRSLHKTKNIYVNINSNLLFLKLWTANLNSQTTS